MLKTLSRPGSAAGRVTANPLVSVIVVNYNGRDRLAACLESLRCQTYSPRELIVVDNNSTDGSVDAVKRDFPEVQIVALHSNRGFAGGCNAGIGVASGTLIATLNNDAVAASDWLEELVRALNGRPDVGMVASKMLFADDPATINSIGIGIDRAGIAWDRSGGSADCDSMDEIEVFGPSGGAAMYRRSVFDDVGLFDEDFFLYFEDVDLAWRARLAGWRCVFSPGARVLHEHSATSVDSSPFKRFHLARNKVWVIAKNYPSPDVWLYLPLIVLFDVAAVFVTLFAGGRPIGVAARIARILGRVVGLIAIASALTKRPEVQRRRRVPTWRVGHEMGHLPTPGALYRRFSHLFKRSVRPNGRNSGLTSD